MGFQVTYSKKRYNKFNDNFSKMNKISQLGNITNIFIMQNSKVSGQQMSNILCLRSSLKYGFCKKLLQYKWTSDQLNTFVLTFFPDQHFLKNQVRWTGFISNSLLKISILNRLLDVGRGAHFFPNFIVGATRVWNKILASIARNGQLFFSLFYSS